MPWYIYILLCDGKFYYVGLTHDVDERLRSHRRRENISTKEFATVLLMYTERFVTRDEAEVREKQLKGWSVAKKKALIYGDLDKLKTLSKSRSNGEGKIHE